MQKDLYTVRDIAQQLNVQERSVRRLILSGELPASKVLRKWVVTAENLKAYIDSMSKSGGFDNEK